MIKFFRKIRQQLLTENKFNKYIIYAIGEIVLVVIGILIALSINNWNEWQQQREKETIVLYDLKENLESNIQLLEKEIKGIKRRNRSGELIYQLVKNGNTNELITPEDWHRALLNGGNLILLQEGYESLKNNGFDIIVNADLKKEIVFLFENVHLGLLKSLQWGSSVQATYDKFILEHFYVNNDEEGNPIFGLIPRDYKNVIKNHYYFGLIDVSRGQRSVYLELYAKVRKHNQRVLQLIKDELDESE
jgi:hypothetical protein